MIDEYHAVPEVVVRAAGVVAVAGAALVAYGLGADQTGHSHRSLWGLGGTAGHIVDVGAVAIASAIGVVVVAWPRWRALLGPVLLASAWILPTTVSLWDRGGLAGTALVTLAAGSLALVLAGAIGVFDIVFAAPMVEADRATMALGAFVALAVAATWWAPYGWLNGPSAVSGSFRISARQFTLDDRSAWAAAVLTLGALVLFARLLWASAQARARAFGAVAVVLLVTVASRIAPGGFGAGTRLDRNIGALVVTALGAVAAAVIAGSSIPAPPVDRSGSGR